MLPLITPNAAPTRGVSMAAPLVHVLWLTAGSVCARTGTFATAVTTEKVTTASLIAFGKNAVFICIVLLKGLLDRIRLPVLSRAFPTPGNESLVPLNKPFMAGKSGSYG